MSRALKGVLLFTGIEIGTLVGWLILAGLPFQDTPMHRGAVVLLAVGLFVEHYISVNVGSGRPAIGPLPPDKKE